MSRDIWQLHFRWLGGVGVRAEREVGRLPACTSLLGSHCLGVLTSDFLCEFLLFYLIDLSSSMTYYFSRYRRKHVPEPLEPLPEPEPSVVDAKSDVGNVGGFHESGGVHLVEMHFPTVYGAGGVIVFILVVVILCWLVSKGHLQRCCYALAVACCGQSGNHGRGSGDAGNQGGGGGRGQGASATPPATETPALAQPSAPIVLPPVMPPIPMQGIGGLDVVRLEQMKTLADILQDRAARRDRRF